MKKVIFLGDSITQGFTLLTKHENVINMGISGNRTIEVINRLDSVINQKPDQLFLMIGINDYMTNNDIWFNDKPIDILKNYDYLLNKLITNLNSTKFYIMPILPVLNDNLIKEEQVRKFNKEIDELNNMIKNLANKYNLIYLEINNLFKNEENNLLKEFTNDGIHLNKLGYEIFYKNICKFIE